MVYLWQLQLGLEKVLWQASRNHGIPNDLELHGQQLFQRSGEWKCLRDLGRGRDAQVATAIYRQALGVIAKSGGHVFARGIDQPALRAQYIRPGDPHELALSFVLERVEKHLRRAGKRSLVIADQLPDSARQNERVSRYANAAVLGNGTVLRSVDFPIDWQDSRGHHGLQAIDLCTYVIKRTASVRTEDRRAERALSALSSAMAPAVRTNSIWVPGMR